jgi:hypothetical protein
MYNTQDFELLMVSAGFEHGGNVTLRFLDGHPELFVYPFESQIGNRHTADYLSSLERFQYRYPEFPAGLTNRHLYELFYDEELKTLLRKPNGSKFKSVDLNMDEENRIKLFCDELKNKPLTRKNIVAAFFKATFLAWENYNRSDSNRIYTGYSPIIGIDADRILADFPNAHIIHVIRNPLSAYADTKKRPFPLSIRQYALSWSLYHHIVSMHQQAYPENIFILRYEDLIENPGKVMESLCQRIKIKPSKVLSYPSWNGQDITNNIYPWGTINQATSQANEMAAMSLDKKEKDLILKYSKMMVSHFNYDAYIEKIMS